MKIAVLSTIAWRTPPRHYGPQESVASNITEELVKRGHDVTLYATGDSETAGKLEAVCPRGYEEDPDIIPKVWESLHISKLFEEAGNYEIIHNHFDFLPLTYSAMIDTPVVTTIHGFSSPGILPVYRKYNSKVYYVSVSKSDQAPDLDYAGTIHHGIKIEDFQYQPDPDDYLLYFGRIHPDKGTREAIEIARACGKRLIIAGIIQDKLYFKKYVETQLLPGSVEFIGSAGPDERSSLLGNAQALLHPISFDEPFGLSVIESMACGTPVIAFNRGSMPELITPNKCGYLVWNTGEAIEAVKKLGEINRLDCRKHAEENFTVKIMADKYEKLFEHIIESEIKNKISKFA